jgi:Ala-tRNA(Pro) deacylase
MDATHCKNLFFRNHKGNKHYLVIFEHRQQLAIRDLELKLKQGKLSFASEKRLAKFLGVKPGSVSLFGLINDEKNQVFVFLDQNLLNSTFLSFHPNDNTASLKISQADFRKFLKWTGNDYEFLELY